MQLNQVADYAVEDSVAVIAINSPPVNAIGASVRQGLAAGIEKALADPDARAIVIVCEGRTFFAGFDITEFGKPPVEPGLRDVQRMLEEAGKPTVAAIHGTALGGGLELALVANYRVAVPSAKFGLPEVKLGLVPGAGGTQRLPRLIGPARALELVTSGEQMGADEALSTGLIDALIEGYLRAGAVDFAKRVIAEGRPQRKVRDVDDKVAAWRGQPEKFDAFRKANARRFRGFLAPENNIRAIEAAVNLPFDQGIAEERRLYLDLAEGPQTLAQRYAFFAERQAARVPGLPDGTPTLPVRRAGIIGAGLMGGGIAMNLLNAGIPVTIVERQQDALDRGVATIRRNYENSVKRGKLSAEAVETRLALLTPALEIEAVADCDVVIEAVFELMEVKQEIFAKLDTVAKPGAILATNTSYLDIDVIAATTRRPENVIGLHFFSPANVMRLLEIVRGSKTSPEVIATSLALAKAMGKLGVVVGNCHGFVGNRMVAKRQIQADELVLEGAAPADVDRVLLAFGFPMGPFQMRDLAGMDIGWDPKKSSSSTVREILAERGWLGQKSGKGYYEYDADRKATPSPEVVQIIADFAASKGISRRSISDEEILDRCMLPMFNEGVKILDEGVASRASDIDVVWLNGYGFPLYRGGVMYWAEREGLVSILERLKGLHAAHGDFFKPAPLLERMVAEGKGFAAT